MAAECALLLLAFAVWAGEGSRMYLHCLTKQVVIEDKPSGSTSRSTEENLGFWIDEAVRTVTFVNRAQLSVQRLDQRWISATSAGTSYEFDRQNNTLNYAGTSMNGGIATIIIGSGRCIRAAGPEG